MNWINILKRATKQTLNQFISDNDALNSESIIPAPSGDAIEAAKNIRGFERGPAVMIHGVSPRCGSVYTGELLSLHSDLFPYPKEMWEIPFLELSGDILNINRKFLKSYNNYGKIGESDFIPLFSSSILSFFHQFAPAEKRLMIKRPKVDYLPHFFKMFPHENLLLLIRDGRDVVSSTVRSWPQANFTNSCKRWNLGAKMIIDFQKNNRNEGVFFTKYEEILLNPIEFVENACRCFNLKLDKYPFDKIKNIPIKGSSSIKKNGRVTWEATGKGKNFNPIGRWKEWSFKEKEIFKSIAGQSLLETGYCDNLKW